MIDDRSDLWSKPFIDFTDQDVDRLRQEWSTKLSLQPAVRAFPSMAESDNLEYTLSSDKSILDALRSEIRTTIFSKVPLRVMKLPEMEFMERNAVADYLIQNKLDNAMAEIHQREAPHLRMWGTHSSHVPINVIRENVISEFARHLTKFAILSHTWGEGEPSYQDFLQKRNTDSKGYKKLKEFCRLVHQEYNVEFAWADTVCIDKFSSTELDESIRSMFAWYHNSFVCIIYLAETMTLVNLPFDKWFTRGWTLQELLAPLHIKFYNKNWIPLTELPNDKGEAGQHSRVQYMQSRLVSDGITMATGIYITHVRRFEPGLRNPPFPERMKWIARRMTTRAEDMSYSMMGILGVSMSVAYGEGSERALFRLFKEVLEVDYSFDWFLWAGKPIPDTIHPSRMIPSSPKCYLSWDPACQPSMKLPKREPISLTNIGLPLKILVVPASVVHTCENLNEIRITCPLSDEEVMTTGVSPQDPVWNTIAFKRYALGILHHSNINVKYIHAILLQKTKPKPPAPPYEPWNGPSWERCATDGTIVVNLKQKFLEKAVSDWVDVKVSREEVRWIEDSEEPKIEFQTLYL